MRTPVCIIRRLLTAFVFGAVLGWYSYDALAATPVTATRSIAWTAPTKNLDGTPITETLTYNVWVGPKGAEVLQGNYAATMVSVALSAGDCVQVSTVGSGIELESARSPEICMETPSVPVSITIHIVVPAP